MRDLTGALQAWIEIGVVEGVQGISWQEITVEGQATKLTLEVEQQQAHVVVDERSENDELRLDRVVRAVGPVIRHAGRAQQRHGAAD